MVSVDENFHLHVYYLLLSASLHAAKIHNSLFPLYAAISARSLLEARVSFIR